MLRLVILTLLVADWQYINNAEHIIAVSSGINPIDMGYRLPIDINSHVFSKYTSVYFKVQPWMSRLCPTWSEMQLHGKSVHSWCCGSSDRCFMVDPLSYFSFQPVLHDWFNKGCGVCYPVCGMVHIKEPLLLIGMSASRGFPLSLSEWAFTIFPSLLPCPTPYNRKNKIFRVFVSWEIET